jgi:hypothetical protein
MTKSWSLYKWLPYKNYPSVNYFWVNPDGMVKYTRSVEDYGYLPAMSLTDAIGCDIEEIKKYLDNMFGTTGKVTKVKTSKMTEEQLSKGMLIL